MSIRFSKFSMSFLLGLSLFSSHCQKPIQRPVIAKKERSGPTDATPVTDKTEPTSNNGTDKTNSETNQPQKPVNGGDSTSGNSNSDTGNGNETKEPETPKEKPPTDEWGEIYEPLAANGHLTGHAGLPNGEYIELRFYLDGDSKTGKSLGTTNANTYGFFFDMPTDTLDTKPHKLFVYVVWKGQEYPLSAKKASYDFRGFQPKGEKIANAFAKTRFFANGATNNRCRSCHAFDYKERFAILAKAAEDNSMAWTAESNALINKLRAGHLKDGGPQIDLCGTTPTTINCDEVVNWWKQEFGP